MATASVVGGGGKQTGVPQETHQQSPTDSILDDYTTKFQKRLDALLKRDDVEIDKMVANAKEHPLSKEYAKITCENAGIDEDDFQFDDHEILEKYVDWELWLEGRSSASAPRVDVATPKVPLPKLQAHRLWHRPQPGSKLQFPRLKLQKACQRLLLRRWLQNVGLQWLKLQSSQALRVQWRSRG